MSEGGAITFPLLGRVAVGGLPVSAAEKKIGSLLEKGGYLKGLDPRRHRLRRRSP